MWGWKEDSEIENHYSFGLFNIEGIGSATARRLVQAAGSAEKVYGMQEESISCFLSPSQLSCFRKRKAYDEIKREYDLLQEQGIRFLSLSHPEYPDKLKEIPDPPFGIYVKGRLPRKDRPAVAVIGTRRCSQYGKSMAEIFGRRLGEAGVQVISGMARGVDGIAQWGALRGGGESYGVLGSGVDICYPGEHKGLYEELIKSGGIISEYGPGTPPAGKQFPPRNRIISGLADCVLVIEAKERSGTLITVDMALEQGREVYVIPGRITDRLSVGCNSLLKQGAGPILSPEELLREINWVAEELPGPKLGDTEELKGMEALVYEQLDFDGAGVQELHDRIGTITVPELAGALVRLCMKGKAVQKAPGIYMKKGSRGDIFACKE